jgi:TetR/AcrR family transcriptional regulator
LAHNEAIFMEHPPSAPTSGTTDRRGATSRAALLSSARRLFATRGFHGTSVGDIADEAGLRKPSLFHHFPTKEALYRAVMDELFAQLATVVAANATPDGTYAERLDAMNDALTVFFAGHPESAPLLFREVLESGAPLGGSGVSHALEILRAAEGFLATGIEAGEFVPQDPKQLLLSLAGIHLTYYAIAPLVTPYLGVAVGSDDAMQARKMAVRAQSRALVVKQVMAKRTKTG